MEGYRTAGRMELREVNVRANTLAVNLLFTSTECAMPVQKQDDRELKVLMEIDSVVRAGQMQRD